MSNKLNRKDAFRKMRQGWILEQCQGVRPGNTWWWIREQVGSSNVLHVHANAARSIARNNLVEKVMRDQFRGYFRIAARNAPPSERKEK